MPRPTTSVRRSAASRDGARAGGAPGAAPRPAGRSPADGPTPGTVAPVGFCGGVGMDGVGLLPPEKGERAISGVSLRTAFAVGAGAAGAVAAWVGAEGADAVPAAGAAVGVVGREAGSAPRGRRGAS